MGKHRTVEQRLADLEARIRTQRARIAERERKQRLAKQRVKGEGGPRFSPIWVASHRRKLGFTAAEYALLVGVSPLTIYSWEKGNSRPRARQLERLAALRGLGIRAARARLAELSGGGASSVPSMRKRRARKA